MNIRHIFLSGIFFFILLVFPFSVFAQTGVNNACMEINSGNFSQCCSTGLDAERQALCQSFYNDNQDRKGSTGSNQGGPLTGAQIPGSTTPYVDPGTVEVPVAKDCAEVTGPNGKITSFLGILLWIRCVISIYILPLIFSVGFAVFLYGVIKYVIAADSKEKEEGKKFLMWGITGLFVMVSVWGIVALVSNTLGLENTVPQLQQNVYCAGGKKWDPVTRACR